MPDLHLLKLGRHFRLDDGCKVILGRNEAENEQIVTLAAGACLYMPENFRGPTAFVQGAVGAAYEETIGAIIARYSQDTEDAYLIKKRVGTAESFFSVRQKFPSEQLEAFRIG